VRAQRLDKHLGEKRPANYIKTLLVYDSSAFCADVQIIPSYDGFRLVAFVVAWEKAVGDRSVATQTNPRVVVARLMCHVFFDDIHWGRSVFQ
jgi:hypothetical protein